MVEIKVCGITREVDYRLAQKLGAQYIGFVFYEDSPRFISAGDAARIIHACPGDNRTVGVFVNEPAECVRRMYRLTGIDIVQLHGEEDPAYCCSLGLPYWKALRLDGITSLDALFRYGRDTVFLIDSVTDGSYSANKAHIPLPVIRQALALCKNIFVAGGVSSENIEALMSLEPRGVDLCSSLESIPGVKDPEKMKQFFKRVSEIQGGIKHA